MKILLAITLLGSLPAVTSFSNYSTPVKEDANVTAYRLTDYNGPGTTDDQHAYFNTLACANAFQAMYPDYVRNGKVSVPEEQVLTCL
jgi:hypothetical protein